MQTMIMAVCVDALKTLHLDNEEEALESSLTNPRGGFTDIGLHTGGHTCDTSWAILESVVQVLLVDNNHLYRTTNCLRRQRTSLLWHGLSRQLTKTKCLQRMDYTEYTETHRNGHGDNPIQVQTVLGEDNVPQASFCRLRARRRIVTCGFRWTARMHCHA